MNNKVGSSKGTTGTLPKPMPVLLHEVIDEGLSHLRHGHSSTVRLYLTRYSATNSNFFRSIPLKLILESVTRLDCHLTDALHAQQRDFKKSESNHAISQSVLISMESTHTQCV